MSNSRKHPKIPLWINVLLIAVNAVPLLLSLLHHWITRAYFDSYIIPLVLATVMAGVLTYILLSTLSFILQQQADDDPEPSGSTADPQPADPVNFPRTPDPLTGCDRDQLLRQLEMLLAQLPEDDRQAACQALLQTEAALPADPCPVLPDAADFGADGSLAQQAASVSQASTAPEETEAAGTELQSVLLAYVDQNCLDSSLCLNSAADHLNTSIYTISRIFKEATGIGFKEYITAKRLQYARHLLETTRKTVSVIAAESGFDNSTYFTTVFKNEYGVPPSKYRANMKHTAETEGSETVNA